MAWESGATPVIVLSKADLCTDVDEKIREVELIAPDVPIHALSSLTGDGVDILRQSLKLGSTACLLGPSGVGKSTLINCLFGEEVQHVQKISSFEDKGRHTSTFRELFILPEGGIIIDTPGMRELQLWESNDELSETFSDVEALSSQCKFSNCTHESEPRCAVITAIKMAL